MTGETEADGPKRMPFVLGMGIPVALAAAEETRRLAAESCGNGPPRSVGLDALPFREGIRLQKARHGCGYCGRVPARPGGIQ